MPQIKLHDPEKGNTYVIEVTEEDAKRAYEGKKNILYKK